MSLPASGSRPGAADEPLITALVADRCPGCGARLAPAAQWCGLCFADLRPAASAADATVGAPATSALSAPAGTAAMTTARPTWPCGACGASVDVDLDACLACGTGFLGSLRTTAGGVELPVVGNLGRYSERGRIVLGAATGLVIAFVFVLLTALLGR